MGRTVGDLDKGAFVRCAIGQDCGIVIRYVHRIARGQGGSLETPDI
jgi:hypothetical protein